MQYCDICGKPIASMRGGQFTVVITETDRNAYWHSEEIDVHYTDISRGLDCMDILKGQLDENISKIKVNAQVKNV